MSAATWYAKPASGGQGLIIDEANGANIAVAYDAQHAPLLAAAPAMKAAILAALELAQEHDPKTGYYRPVDPYNLARILRAALPVALGVRQ